MQGEWLCVASDNSAWKDKERLRKAEMKRKELNLRNSFERNSSERNSFVQICSSRRLRSTPRDWKTELADTRSGVPSRVSSHGVIESTEEGDGIAWNEVMPHRYRSHCCLWKSSFDIGNWRTLEFEVVLAGAAWTTAGEGNSPHFPARIALSMHFLPMKTLSGKKEFTP